ncbi:MAG: hypothetical protein [Caudoviricetes sp.]|nr:MAG: hypothetical protein [Caudoviricetes sp.]
MTKLSGGLNNWYIVPVKNPQRKEQEPYQAECEDIIQALGMTFDEGCAFKALWRNASARMGNGKPGNTAVYDSEKLVHYANRILAKERVAAIVAPFLESKEIWFTPDHGHDLLPNVRVEIETPTGGRNILRMQDVRWESIKRFRYVDGVPERQPESGDGGRPVSNKARDDGWVYSSVRPEITQPFRDIEVVYCDNYKRTYAHSRNVVWKDVLKYRINYV